MHTVSSTLHELGVGDRPILTVLNKIDLYRDTAFDDFVPEEVRNQILQDLVSRIEQQFETRVVVISAFTKENMSALREALQEMVESQYAIRYPYRTKTIEG
jgi:GTP-binding protein HflX